MKKKLIYISIIIVILSIFVTKYINNNYSNNIITNTIKNNATTSTISMMVETEAASGIYEASSDTSWPTSGYKFNSTLSKCENSSTLTWDSDNSTVIYSGTTADKCYVYFDLIPTIADVCNTGDNLSNCIQLLYTSTGEATVGLYYFDGLGDYENYDQEYVDYRYIYSGGTDDVYNYLCLGSDYTDTSNLYRILGIYLNDDNEYEVKAMKYEYSDNTLTIDSTSGWEYTSLYTYLNDTFLTSISDYDDLIETHTWKIPTNYNGGYTALTHAGYVSSATQTVDAKIALIYDSDVGYAADISYWTYTLDSYNVTTDYNWMYGKQSEWILSYYAFSSYIYASALIYIDAYDYSYFCGQNVQKCRAYYSSKVQNYYAVRPTFYLSTDVAYSSGIGTLNDPIILVTE